MTKENTPIKELSYRIPHCGTFPNYQLDGTFLNEKNIIYLVSVGKEKFEGKWVDRFVNFIKEIKPKKTIVVVADSLQRFNIEIDENISKIEALKESKNRGKEWVEKYGSQFSNLNINSEFIHWDTLREDKDFKLFFDEIKNLSDQNAEFKEDLLSSSEEYTERRFRLSSNNSLNLKKAERNSCDFLKEECAVLLILAKKKDNLAIVYPGAATKVLASSIAYINKNHRIDNSFHWLEMRPTKKRKKNKELDTPTKAPLFRRFSLDESQSFNMEAGKIKENKLNPFTLFKRRPSLKAEVLKTRVKYNFI